MTSDRDLHELLSRLRGGSDPECHKAAEVIESLSATIALRDASIAQFESDREFFLRELTRLLKLLGKTEKDAI